MFPGVILVFAVGWVLYVVGKKYERPLSPAPVRTDLNTPNTLFETPAEMPLPSHPSVETGAPSPF
jgi:hypothetical protein